MGFGFLLAGFLLAANGSDASPDPARAIIEKAVNAMGGIEALTQPSASRSRIKGTFFGSTEFEGESYHGGNGKIRLIMHFKEQGSRVTILNGGKGWSQFNGATQEMDETTLNRMLKARYVDRVCSLVSLVRDKDKGYTLTVVEETNVENKPAVGVKVATEGQPDVILYFDKTSGFFVKSVYRQAQVDGREALMEAYYRDYLPVDYASEIEKTLRDAQRSINTPDLLAYLNSNIPTAAEQQEISKRIEQLGARSFGAREQASVALQQFGIKAGALLQKTRASNDIEVTRRVAKCIEALAQESALATAAVRLLNIRRAAPTEALLAYYPWAPDESTTQEVRDAVLASIRRQKEPEPIWQNALKHEDARIRQLAAAALGKDDAVLKQPGQRLFIEGLRLSRVSSTFMDGQKRMDLETLERVYFNRLDEKLFEPDQD